MQFQVPQFIEVEDKIFGPFTFRQFIYLVGGAGACYLVWRVLPVFVSLPLIIFIAPFSVALAFFQMNGRPFILALESGFFYLIHSKLYLWNNTKKPLVAREKTKTAAATKNGLYIPRLSDSKLHELAWSLDIRERIASGTTVEAERQPAPVDVLAPVRTARDAMTKAS
ncbi:PrgI family protein [Candidatus Kaiserbacteria bacterium]|nr:PrgI family protein [Candidatus Kaiserbacteria bacterium]